MGAFSGGRKARQLRLGGPPLLVPRAPGEERLDLPFLYALPLAIGAKRVPKTYFVRHRCHSCAQLYEVLLPLLEAEDESADAWPSTPQRAGTCYAKCIFLTLRVLLGHFGLGKDALKKWMLNFRIGYLEKMVSDLQQSCHKLTISDRIILTVALKQVARRCAREAYAVPARGRVHVCLQKIWLAAPPVPWLGYFAAKMEAKEPALQLPNTSSSGLGFQGFQLLVASALIPPEVRNAFAGPSATKSSNPHVDLTGIASASASGPSLEAVLQAALMCDRLEEVLGCSLRSKQLILGVVESLVFWEGQSLWQRDLGQLKLARGREVLAAIHRLGAHYLAGARSGFLGRCGSSTGVLVLASLLELFERVLMATASSKLAEAVSQDGRALWALRPWQKDGRPPSFADLTAWMPMTSPAMLEVRDRLCRHQSAAASGSESLLRMEDPSLLLFGPPEHQGSELSSAEAVGCGKAFAELVSKLVSVVGLKGQSPTLPAVERPYQDWEVQVAWAFDPNLEAACPEWAQARDLIIFFQMLLSSVPALSQSLEGQGVAPAGDAALSASSMAECGFSLSLFNPPSKLTVKVLHICTIASRHANFLYTQPSLAHPKVLCPSLPYLRFGGSLENEIASTPHLPDFDFSLTQAQAETLLMILNCPGLRIPMLLQFVVPNHVALLHHRQFQRIFFACLFEPGPFPKEPREEKAARPPKVQSLREAKVPCLEPMAIEFGWLSTEMAT
ncbi:unnamed protein product [Symbiodinium microadriaticum]|nr:unnamed protein product [Symbiodinium microadriaticum]